MGGVKKIKKLAIANRGEVAVRILRACEEMGVKTVLLHSEADVKTRAYREADEKVCIGPASSSESYLNIKNNVDGAKSVGADAVHPGFGFLSENPSFAKAVEDAGMIFVGPRPDAISKMGDKMVARDLVGSAGVPLVPGYQGEDQSKERLASEAKSIGYPLIIKVASGGGGRGLKVVRSDKEFLPQLDSAQREGLGSFGSDKVFLEKYIEGGKHIEFQILADEHGNVIHLFDRECSVQRRHQKIIEEACSPSLDQTLRSAMAEAAVDAAKSCNYRGAGTVEFLLKGNHFYFLEMNTRLQVEHPVTEEVTGIDLVKAQIQVAEGKPLSWEQSDINRSGHSIECRLYAEDPYLNGVPSTGEILDVDFTHAPGRRWELGFEKGDEVSSFYDSMIAKVIVYDTDRESCRRKMLKTLEETVVFGVKTNIPYLKEILNHEEFIDGSMTTLFIEQNFPEGIEKREVPSEVQALARSLMKSGTNRWPTEASRVSVFDGSWRNV